MRRTAPASHRGAPIFGLVAGLVLVALLTACNRKPRLIPAGSDSTHAALVDSFALMARDAQQRWESGGDGTAPDAAALTARVLLADFNAHSAAALDQRAHTLLDSLTIGGEIAGGERLAAVNLFARFDPEGDSWPYLFWRDGARTRSQAIEGRGLHLNDLTVRAAGTDSAKVALLFGRRAPSGQQPMLMSWARRGPGWELRQTLGPDSLGGVGTAEFETHGDSADVVARTHRGTPRFEECGTCPHVYHMHRFHWGPAGWVGAGEQQVPSPYACFVQLIQALLANDKDGAERMVTDHKLVDAMKKAEWDKNKAVWRAAPATDESAQTIVFFRGADEAWRVSFEQRGGNWMVSDFEPTSHSIE